MAALRLALAAALLVLLLLPAAAAAADPGPPRCHGAASRDPARPCVNPKLRYRATPTPDDALLAPASPCSFAQRRPLAVCQFQDRPEAPAAHVALIGDSHAAHWRAALESVRELGWSGVSMTAPGCPFTLARRVLDRARLRGCRRRNALVPKYLREHPEIETVFFSANAGGEAVRRRGSSQAKAQVSGYHRAWRLLPASVKHVVVIRDTPINSSSTNDCVTRALRARRPPGPSCAVPRRFAMRPDYAAVAAARLRSTRFSVIDMTRFFCSARLCQPVIGGVLVHKDPDHITTTYAQSLGPYLLRHVRRLSDGWAR